MVSPIFTALFPLGLMGRSISSLPCQIKGFICGAWARKDTNRASCVPEGLIATLHSQSQPTAWAHMLFLEPDTILKLSLEKAPEPGAGNERHKAARRKWGSGKMWRRRWRFTWCLWSERCYVERSWTAQRSPGKTQDVWVSNDVRRKSGIKHNTACCEGENKEAERCGVIRPDRKHSSFNPITSQQTVDMDQRGGNIIYIY